MVERTFEDEWGFLEGEVVDVPIAKRCDPRTDDDYWSLTGEVAESEHVDGTLSMLLMTCVC